MAKETERLRAFMIRSSRSRPNDETIGLLKTYDQKIYAYSEYDFDIWFKVNDQWIKSSSDPHCGGVCLGWPKGSTEVFFQHTRPNQLVLGFKDLDLDFGDNPKW